MYVDIFAPVLPVKVSCVTSVPSLKNLKLDVATSMFHSAQCQVSSNFQL